MCLSLGLHRKDSLKEDALPMRERKTWLFWSIYIIDKGLSVRLGRPSTIQDYDITVPAPNPHMNQYSMIEFCIVFWVRIARIQGRLYELLFSPTALAQPDNIRAARAQALADEVVVIIQEKKETEVRCYSHSASVMSPMPAKACY